MAAKATETAEKKAKKAAERAADDAEMKAGADDANKPPKKPRIDYRSRTVTSGAAATSADGVGGSSRGAAHGQEPMLAGDDGGDENEEKHSSLLWLTTTAQDQQSGESATLEGAHGGGGLLSSSVAQLQPLAQDADSDSISDDHADEVDSFTPGEKNTVLDAVIARIGELAARTEEFPAFIPMQSSFDHVRYYVRECYEQYYKLVMEDLYTPKRLGESAPARTKNGVTITGTPGIGKSVFLAYFYLRYIEEHPSATVTFASYNRGMRLVEVAVRTVSSDGRTSAVHELASQVEWTMLQFLEDAENKAKGDGRPCIRLCDGPPTIEPRKVKYLVCSSPNEMWLRNLRVETRHTTYYMPLWPLEELASADLALRVSTGVEKDSLVSEIKVEQNQKIPSLECPKTISERFFTFGGAARWCLCPDQPRVDAQKRDLVDPILRCTSLAELEGLVRSEEATVTHHRMLHYVPDPSNLQLYTPCLASQYVEQVLCEQILKLGFQEQEKLAQWLGDRNSGKSLTGVLFEAGCHKKLALDGLTITARKLPRSEKRVGGGDREQDQDADAQVTFLIEPSHEFCYYKHDFTRAQLTAGKHGAGPYFIPRSKRAASIDAFYYPMKRDLVSGEKEDAGTGAAKPTEVSDKGGDAGGAVKYAVPAAAKHNSAAQTSTKSKQGSKLEVGPQVLLFQMTVSENHPEKASGLRDVLKQLGLMDRSLLERSRVALVFVVPKGKAATFRRQRIVQDVAFGDFANASVDEVFGIAGGKKATLAKAGIKTVIQLLEKVEAGGLQEYRKLVENHVAQALGSEQMLEILRSIPQYVCEI